MELQADDADFGEAAMVDFSVIGTEGRDFYFDGNKLFAKVNHSTMITNIPYAWFE